MARGHRSGRFILTGDQVRAVDRYAIERLGIPGIVLMENAGRGATDYLGSLLRRRLKKVGKADGARVAVVCGKGNNAGDGFVIARHLKIRGHTVFLDLAAEPGELTPDAAANHAIAVNMDIPVRTVTSKRTLALAANRWRTCDALVDALLGTGIKGQVREPYASIIGKLNTLRGPLKLAVDVPSGMNVDTGTAEGPVFRADHTVTFVAAKESYTTRAARDILGKLKIVDIGAPAEQILRALGIPGRRYG